jgi:hypothetical protein
MGSWIKQMMVEGEVKHEIKVTHLGKGLYGCRCYLNGILNQESEPVPKSMIGEVCRDMLRWEDKMGNYSPYATRARERMYEKERKETAWKQSVKILIPTPRKCIV